MRMLLRAPLRALATQAVKPLQQPQTLQFYFNRLFVPSGYFLTLIPSALVTAHYSRLKDDLQSKLGAELGRVTRVEPRPAEGGAFVTIEAVDPAEARKVALQGLSRRWLLVNHHSRGHEVKGTPWKMDLARNISRKVQVVPPLDEEECYELLRPYGRIRNIANGEATFWSLQDAITASFCANRAKQTAEGMPIRLKLVPRPSLLARLRGWLSGHPRVVIPAVIAVLFALAYVVFEPIRELSISAKIKGTLEFVMEYFEWARESTQIFSKREESDDEVSFLHSDNLLENASLLRASIRADVATFTVVVGPKGSGKSEALALATERSDLGLSIDCDRLKGVSDESMLRNLASSVGYWPLFLWTNNVFRAAEVGIQGIFGQNTGMSETTEQQVERVLQTASHAIRSVALRNAQTANEAKYLETHPDQLPIICLSNYSGTERASDHITKWAYSLVENRIARVVVVTPDAHSFDKSVGESLPDNAYRVVRIKDVAPQAAKEHVVRLLSKQPDSQPVIAKLNELGPEFLQPLGGRFTDLQAFAQRLVKGESPQTALQNLIHSAALEVERHYLNEDKARNWTVEQSWELVKLLAYDSAPGEWFSVPGFLAKNSIVPAEGGPLKALESSGMVMLRSVGDRVTGIKAARPIFGAAFSQLVSDPLVKNDMTVRTAKFQMAQFAAKIDKAEKELATLATLPSYREVKDRQDFVAKQLGEAQAKYRRSESELEAAKATIQLRERYTPGTPSTWGNITFDSRFE